MHLARLTALTSLNLSHNTRLGDAGVACIAERLGDLQVGCKRAAEACLQARISGIIGIGRHGMNWCRIKWCGAWSVGALRSGWG